MGSATGRLALNILNMLKIAGMIGKLKIIADIHLKLNM